MKILFTRSGSLLSRLIRHVSGEPVSHCALDCGGWIIHSNLLGLHVELPQTFEKHSEIVYSVSVDFDQQKVMSIFAQYDQDPYDFGALLYLGLRFLLPFLPEKNLWQSNGMFLCTEWVTEAVYGSPDSSITPYRLYLKLTGPNGPNKEQ